MNDVRDVGPCDAFVIGSAAYMFHWLKKPPPSANAIARCSRRGHVGLGDHPHIDAAIHALLRQTAAPDL